MLWTRCQLRGNFQQCKQTAGIFQKCQQSAVIFQKCKQTADMDHVPETSINPNVAGLALNNIYEYFSSTSDSWPQKMFEMIPNTANIETCAAICVLKQDTCNMFVFNEEQCYVGQFDKTDGNLVVTADTQDLYVRIGTIT